MTGTTGRRLLSEREIETAALDYMAQRRGWLPGMPWSNKYYSQFSRWRNAWYDYGMARAREFEKVLPSR